MAETFDPYLKWLGIRQQKGRLNHYRLLGLEHFESDQDVIVSAAKRQIRHIRSFQKGRHTRTAIRIEKELKNARDCLLNGELRAKYDEALRRSISTQKILKPEKPKPIVPESVVVDPVVPTETTAIPNIRSRTKRPKKNRAVLDMAGWVLGAIGAVVFAYVLLNTDLIDRINGRPQNVADNNQPFDIVKSPGTSSKQETPRARINRQNQPVTIENRPDTSRDLNSPLPATRINWDAPPTPTKEPSPVSSNPNPTTPKTKLPVPDRESVRAAIKLLTEIHKPQIKGSDIQAKRSLSKTLLSNFDVRQEPEKGFAILETSAKLAGDSGALDTVLKAVEVMGQHFQIDFWEQITVPAESAIKSNVNFEEFADGLSSVLDLARTSEQFEWSARFASLAAKVAQKHGDLMQRDMLANYAKDMKSLNTSKKKFESLFVAEKLPEAAKDKLAVGKYLCFGKGDWDQGLPVMIDGPDRILAEVAKLDLEASGDGFSIAQSWANLSKKGKYKGLDRRCMLERALQMLEQSGRSNSETQQATDFILQNNQTIKRYVSDTSRMRSKTYVFDVRGPATFDSAQLEQGSVLRLGLRQKTKALPLQQSQQSLITTSSDRKVRFQIRLLNTGIAEMRLFDTATNSLQNILYGK